MKLNKPFLFVIPILITHLAVFIALWLGGLISNDMGFAMYIYQEAQPAAWFIGVCAGVVLVIMAIINNDNERNF